MLSLPHLVFFAVLCEVYNTFFFSLRHKNHTKINHYPNLIRICFVRDIKYLIFSCQVLRIIARRTELLKSEHNNLVFVFTLSPPIDYPPQKLRYRIFGKPILESVEKAGMVFSHLDVEYFKNQNGKMDRIDVACFNPDIATAKDIATMKSTDTPLNASVLTFFVQVYFIFLKNFKTLALCEVVRIPQEETLEDWVVHRLSKPFLPFGEWPMKDKAALIEFLEKALKSVPESARAR